MSYKEIAQLDLTAYSFVEKAQKAIEALWDEGIINEETIEQWGAEHLRTTFLEPSERTEDAITEAMLNKEKETYDNVDELMKKLTDKSCFPICPKKA